MLVVLDSNHSRAHVEAELDLYAPLVSPGSYIVACDGIMAQLAGAPRTAPDWAWNNPIAAVDAFLARNPDFVLEEPGFPFNEGARAQPRHLLAQEFPQAAMIGVDAMKAVILAGGLGTRIAEESHLRPKPMIEIGGRPILWHVMNIYTSHGVTDFIICLGYRGYMIKEYFANYVMHESDLTVDARNREITYHTNYAEPWRVTLVDTGADTMTGGRLKRVSRYLDPDESFCMTYGDGVADIDIGALIAFHRRHGRLATVTAVTPPGRYRRAAAAGRSGRPASARSRPATTR